MEAKNAGSLISEELFNCLSQNYAIHLPNHLRTLVFDKSLLLRTLKTSDQVTGIRFTYGLSDIKNIYSTKVLLVPCTSNVYYDQIPLVLNQHYLDHEGNQYSIERVAEMIYNFVIHSVEKENFSSYERINRGSFFGAHSLDLLLTESNCKYIQFNFGMDNKKILHPILNPLDCSYRTNSRLYLENSWPPRDSDPDEICLAKFAVDKFSNENELNRFRNFRDQELLTVKDGGMLYELYYFISPYIVNVLKEQSDGLEHLQNIYDKNIMPLYEEIMKGNLLKAVDHLKRAFKSLIDEYSVDQIESSAATT
ncbi:MAG: hypothetical protein AAF616_10820 [Bacteroidota bacterium]